MTTLEVRIDLPDTTRVPPEVVRASFELWLIDLPYDGTCIVLGVAPLGRAICRTPMIVSKQTVAF